LPAVTNKFRFRNNRIHDVIGNELTLCIQSRLTNTNASGRTGYNLTDLTDHQKKGVSAVYRKILVPLDGSELAECSLLHVRNLLEHGCVGEVTVLNVFWALSYPMIGGMPPSSFINRIIKKASDTSRKYLDDVEMRLAADGLQVKTESMEGDRPAFSISEYAQKNGMDLIVMGTHGYTGLKKVMLGSVALEVLHNAHVPVLLIPVETCTLK
jgi:nucleotide-binding universal stress UspA family protein